VADTWSQLCVMSQVTVLSESPSELTGRSHYECLIVSSSQIGPFATGSLYTAGDLTWMQLTPCVDARSRAGAGLFCSKLSFLPLFEAVEASRAGRKRRAPTPATDDERSAPAPRTGLGGNRAVATVAQGQGHTQQGTDWVNARRHEL
jgi:hypothetical protein